MKIRIGFVANSSSTNFIVCINPKDTLSDWKEEIKIDLDRINDDNEYDPEFLVSFNEVWKDIKELQKGEVIYEPENYGKWSVLSDIFHDSDKTILQIDTFESGGKIVNICAPEYIQRIKRLMGD